MGDIVSALDVAEAGKESLTKLVGEGGQGKARSRRGGGAEAMTRTFGAAVSSRNLRIVAPFESSTPSRARPVLRCVPRWTLLVPALSRAVATRYVGCQAWAGERILRWRSPGSGALRPGRWLVATHSAPSSGHCAV